MDWGMRCRKLLSGEKCSHSHKTRTDSLETRAVFLIFSLELEISGVAGQKIHQSTKNDGFCEELLSKNDFVKIVNGLVNIYPIPTLPVGIGNTLAIFTTNQYALLSIECTGISSSWLNWRGEEGLFWRLQKERHIVHPPPPTPQACPQQTFVWWRRTEDVSKTSSRYNCKTSSWRNIEDVLKKTSCKRLEHVLRRHLEDVFGRLLQIRPEDVSFLFCLLETLSTGMSP